MYNKYKVKKKFFSSVYIIMIFSVIIVFFSVGYSILATSLTIEGVVTIKNNDTDIPVEILPGTGGGTEYVSFTVADNVLEVVNQTIVEDTINVDLKSNTNTGKPRNMDITMNFLNNSNYTYRNGTVTYEITGDTNFIKNQPTVSTTTTLQPGEEGEITALFTGLKFNSLNTSCICKFTITYIVNNAEVCFYIILNISK